MQIRITSGGLKTKHGHTVNGSQSASKTFLGLLSSAYPVLGPPLAILKGTRGGYYRTGENTVDRKTILNRIA